MRKILVSLSLVLLALCLSISGAKAEPLSILNASQEQKLAYIYAPDTGKCTLRSGPARNSHSITQCKTGVIVQVLEMGNDYAKIDYQGTEGYVLGGCLTMYSFTDRIVGTGMLHLQGKTDGQDLINIRSRASKDSAVVTKWPTGKEVLIFDRVNSGYVPEGWWEIEGDGLRGFVMAEYLEINIPDYPRYEPEDITADLQILGVQPGDMTLEAAIALAEPPLEKIAPLYLSAEQPWRPEGKIAINPEFYTDGSRFWRILWKNEKGESMYQVYVHTQTGLLFAYQRLHEEEL